MKSKQSLVLLGILVVLLSPLGKFLSSPAHAQVPQNIGVSAVVPPNQSDFQYTFATTDNKSTVAEEETLSYQITYSALASGGVTTTTKIVVNWDDAIAPNGAHIVDYALGSASTAYGNTSPVVDLENRTLTWTIPALPAGTVDQKVTFNLKTNSNYTDSAHVPFTILAAMSNQYVSLAEQTISQNYAYDPAKAIPTVTPTAAVSSSTTSPTETPASSIKKLGTIATIVPTTPNNLPTPQPTPQTKPQQTLTITDVSLREISQSSAKIAITTNNPTAVWVKLGTSPRAVVDAQAILKQNTSTVIPLNDLSPATTYYVQLKTVDEHGQSITSEIFSFTTANASQVPDLDKNIVVITNNGDVLVSDVKDKNFATTPLALLTMNSNYEFTYRLRNKLALKSIEAVVRNKVLGISTIANAQEQSTFTVPMKEREPSVYVATLKTFFPGTFEMFVRIVDVNGNITEQKIAEVKVMRHLSVTDSTTQKPLADARIFLYSYNEQTHLYESLSNTVFKRIQNPSYTDLKGEAALTLPQGKYRAKVSTFGYDEKIVDFVLGAKADEDFPQISLHKNLFSLTNLIRYYQNAFIDFLNHFSSFLSSLSFSLRFFNLIASIIVASFVFISFLLFTMRTHIRFTHIPAFFFHNIERLFQRTTPIYIAGIVVDEENNLLTRAHIECLDAQTGKVLAHMDTNKVGKFYLRRDKDHVLKLITTRDGYMQNIFLLHPDVEPSKDSIQITMQSGIKHHPSALAVVVEQFENIAGMFFEFVLVFTIIIECFFFTLFTFASTLPFFALSLLNVVLWLFFIREHFEQKFIK